MAKRKEEINQVIFARVLRDLRRRGFTKRAARAAATGAARPIHTISELTNPAGLVWIKEHGRGG